MPDSPHSPLHRLGEAGAYIVTAAIYKKQPLFHSAERLTLVRDILFRLCHESAWLLQAWAILPNHYHFVALSPPAAETLRPLLKRLHAAAATQINREDKAPGRRVWFQYWDTHLTHESSYLARLSYVHENPAHHGLVRRAEDYPWCSAAWFARTATPAFYRRIRGLRIDRVKVVEVDCPLEF
jgi:putative transposase